MCKELENENLCKKCGKCCYAKFTFMGKVFIDTRKPCKYLDLQTKQCTVYDKRHEVEPNCLKIKEALYYGVMPEECEYVKEFIRIYGKYRAPEVIE